MNAALEGRHVRAYRDATRAARGDTVRHRKLLQGVPHATAVVPVAALAGVGAVGAAEAGAVAGALHAAAAGAMPRLASPPASRSVRYVGAADVSAHGRLAASGLLAGDAGDLDASALSAISARSASGLGGEWDVSLASARSGRGPRAARADALAFLTAHTGR